MASYQTFRFVLTRPVLEDLGITTSDPDLAVFPKGHHGYAQVLFVMVCTIEQMEDGHTKFQVVSTTMLPIHKFDIKNLFYVGVYQARDVSKDSVLGQVVMAHLHADEEKTAKIMASDRHTALVSEAVAEKQRMRNQNWNGAGDLNEPLEFVMLDPELLELERLYGDGQSPDYEDEDE